MVQITCSFELLVSIKHTAPRPSCSLMRQSRGPEETDSRCCRQCSQAHSEKEKSISLQNEKKAYRDVGNSYCAQVPTSPTGFSAPDREIKTFYHLRPAAKLSSDSRHLRKIPKLLKIQRDYIYHSLCRELVAALVVETSVLPARGVRNKNLYPQ